MGSYLVIIAVLIIFFCFRRRRRTAVVAWQILWRLLCSFIGIVISVITRKSRKIHPALWISGIISCMLGFIVCMF